MTFVTRLASLTVLTVLATAGSVVTAAPALAAAADIYASPDGSGTDCSSATPCSLEQAQQAVRAASGNGDVVVQLTDGRYELTKPMDFRPEDGGQGDSTVVWKAAPGASPEITGAKNVTGWSVYDAGKNIWSASIPVGDDTRNLSVDGELAPRAAMQVDNGEFELTAEGLTLISDRTRALASLPQQDRIEFRAVNNFTDRYAPVVSISDDKAVMAQPAWRNNLWGYDTVPSPGSSHFSRSLENSLSFISDPGEWYADPEAGRLYYKPADGVDPSSLDVEIPQQGMESLVSIGGTYDDPIRNLSFEGIQFSGTSWMGPSSNEGLASQQSGAYLAGDRDYYPAPFSCSNGCAAFERARTSWSQAPAAVQVSAAQNISFVGNRFIGLGQIALGVGNDAKAMSTGVGLGAQNVTVRGNLFTQLGGGAIVVGGVLADAHHPSRPEMVNKDIVFDANTVTATSFTYGDNTGILSTYVDTALITRNEVSDLPYDGIDIGYGWGINDPGGAGDYEQRGYYQFNPRYETPTTLRSNLIAENVVHDIKKVFGDGGAIYTLSAAPDSVIRDNYIYANRDKIGIYLDEGARYMRLYDNVVRDSGPYFYMNTGSGRNMFDNIADRTWHMGGYVYGDLSEASGNKVIDDRPVYGDQWPAGAQEILCRIGVPAEYRSNLNTDSCPAPVAVSGGWQSFSSASESRISQVESSFSIGAAGDDIWGAGGQRDDEYAAVYRDGAFADGSTITARIDAVADVNPYAKTGVFIRDDATQAGSSAGYAGVVMTPGDSVALIWDADGDCYIDNQTLAAAPSDAPVWVRLRRAGDAVTGWFSLDGSTWSRIGQEVTLPGLAGEQDAGVISSSHDGSTFGYNAVSAVQIVKDVAAPWQSFAASEARIAQTADDAFSIAASGADMWEGVDVYGTVFQPSILGEGGSVTARVDVDDSNAWAKSGVAVRNDLTAPGSAKGYAVIAATPGNGVSLQWDSNGDGYLDRLAGASVSTSQPVWVRLTRAGSSVVGSYSTDGSIWNTVGTAGLASPDVQLDAGVVTTSHEASLLADNLFTDVAIEAGTPTEPGAARAFSTNGGVAGESNGTITITGAGADVWGFGGQRDDDYTAYFVPQSADASTVATVHVASQQNTNKFAKAGLMLRNDITGAGTSTGYAVLAVTPENGVVFEWDATGDGYLETESRVDLAPTTPLWLRLIRDGATVAGQYSSNGTAWMPVGSATLTSPADTQDVGLFSLSHDRNRQGTSTFDSYTVKDGVTPTPTPTPTAEPTVTPGPTATPTVAPTQTPTPTAEPTVAPTAEPTAEPTATPTPTVAPTATPTAEPTVDPTVAPTAEPTATPTAQPTVTPTASAEPTATATATPAPVTATATLSASSVELGGTVRVTVTGVLPGEQLTAKLFSDPIAITGIPAADASGRVEFDVRLPAFLEAGQHSIVILRADGSQLARLPLTVVAKGTLAATGAAAPLGVGLLGASLLTAGALAWVLRRRRTA